MKMPDDGLPKLVLNSLTPEYDVGQCRLNTACKIKLRHILARPQRVFCFLTVD